MIRLSERLRTVAECVDKGNTVADIGTDHAYIPVYLVQSGTSDQVWACDIRQGPVDNALKTIRQYGLEARIGAVLAPGLNGLSGPVDTIIIAGMGGLLIAEIIEERLELARQAKQLILQPMTASIELRRFLLAHGFRIEHEQIAIEGPKFYEIIVAQVGSEQAFGRPLDYELSPVLLGDPDEKVLAFVRHKADVARRIIDQLRSSRKPASMSLLPEWQERLEELMEVEKSCVSILKK